MAIGWGSFVTFDYFLSQKIMGSGIVLQAFNDRGQKTEATVVYIVDSRPAGNNENLSQKQ